MTTIASAQEALSHWHQALAVATGGKIFTTHGCSWAWQPVRRRLVLLFPENPEPAGLRPALAEGMRLGARRVLIHHRRGGALSLHASSGKL